MSAQIIFGVDFRSKRREAEQEITGQMAVEIANAALVGNDDNHKYEAPEQDPA